MKAKARIAAIVILATGAFAGGAAGAEASERGYELIDSAGQYFSVGVSDDGGRVTYFHGAGAPTLTTATRSASGWQPRSMMPPPNQELDILYSVVASTPDRSKLFISGPPTLAIGISQPATMLRLDAQGNQTVFGTLPASEPSGVNLDAVMSDDGEHAFARLLTPFDPEHVPGTVNVYDLAHPTPQLVSRLPDQSVPTCGIEGGIARGFASQTESNSAAQHWNSTDGSIVFFLSRGSGDCSGAFELYSRDLVNETTELISGPALANDSDATFLQANPSGTGVVYETAASLVAEDTNGDPDIYRWTVGAGNACLTCVVPDANVKPSDQLGFSGSVAVSPDLSHVYFASQNELAPGATAGEDNLYVWHVTPSSGPVGEVDFASPIRFGLLAISSNPAALGGGEVTPDGNVFVFTSNAPGLNAFTGQPNGGRVEYYRYDDTDPAHPVVCMSCPSVGVPTKNVPLTILPVPTGNLSWAGVLSDDGSRFVFKTPEALVPQDHNQGSDIYEWHDGTVSLITDGISFPSASAGSSPASTLWGMSADGRDLIFSSNQRLTPDAEDGSLHLYDARLGGGFQFPTAPAACDGEQCQGPPSNPPAFEAPSSADLSGGGNLRHSGRKKAARKACKGKPAKQRKKCESRASKTGRGK